MNSTNNKSYHAPVPKENIRTDRLKKFQKSKNMRAEDVATEIGISTDSYKNIFRTTGNIKNINYNTLQALAQLFECTIDYILGTSDDPHLDSRGVAITYPLIDDGRKKLLELNKYLKKDYQTLNNLHFMLCVLPVVEQNTLRQALNLSLNMLRQHSLFAREDSMNDMTLNALKKMLRFDSTFYSSNLILLAEADSYFGKKCFKRALLLYLIVIYNTLKGAADTSNDIAPTATDLTTQALNQISALQKNWSKFPKEELHLIIAELCTLEKQKFFNTSAELLEKINNYITQQPLYINKQL